jgi:hypothetical protein
MVSVKLKSRDVGRAEYLCEACGMVIQYAELFYEWAFYPSKKLHHQHHRCGHPRPSQLTTSALSPLMKCIEDGQDMIAEWRNFIWEWYPVDTLLLELKRVSGAVRDVYHNRVFALPLKLRHSTQAMQEAKQVMELDKFRGRLANLKLVLRLEEMVEVRWQMLVGTITSLVIVPTTSTITRYRRTGGIVGEPALIEEDVTNRNVWCRICKRHLGRGRFNRAVAVYGPMYKKRPIARLCTDVACHEKFLQLLKEEQGDHQRRAAQ